MVNHSIHVCAIDLSTQEMEMRATQLLAQYSADLPPDEPITVYAWELIVDGKLLAYAESGDTPKLTDAGRGVFGA